MDQPTEISALPPEMLTQILQHLALADLIKLKSVCKLWNELISSNVKVTGLVVDTVMDIRHRFWYSSPNKPFDYRQMPICNLDLFLRNRDKPILSQLKFLRLNPGIGRQPDLSWINSFSKLLRLDFNFQPSGYLEVNLEKLEILKIWNNREGFVRVDCPKLRVLLYEQDPAGCIEIVQPKSIVELNTITYNYHLTAFENLEVLKCGTPHMLNELILTRLPKLKKVYYDSWYGDREREHLKRFFAIKNELKRADLQIFLSNIPVTTTMDEIDFGVTQEDGTIDDYDFEHFIMRNYERLQDDPFSSVCEVNYSRLMSATDQLPTDYFERFPNIEGIIVDRPVENPEHFLWYLQNLKGEICQLMLKNSGLDQSFYDSLPTFCSPYRFCEFSEGEQSELNYRFLAEFEYLQNATVGELTLESARSLLDSHANLKHFFELQFHFNGQSLRLSSNKTSNTKTGFTLLIHSKIVHHAERLDELIEWMKSNVFV